MECEQYCATDVVLPGLPFRIYAEGVSRGYVGGNTGLYVIRHNPFALLSDIADSKTVADAHLYPFTQFATDVANGTLPKYSFIVPNIDDDAHSGSPQQADTWLHSKVIAPLSTIPHGNREGGSIDCGFRRKRGQRYGAWGRTCCRSDVGADREGGIQADFQHGVSSTRVCCGRKWGCWGFRIPRALRPPHR